MTIFNLDYIAEKDVKVGKSTKKEEVYCYRDNKGEEIKFHAHPTKAWNWVIVNGDPKKADKLINAFLEVGMSRKPESGIRFTDSIRKLKI